MAKFATRSLLTYRHSHPIVLDLFLVKEFGAEYYGWDANTLWHEAVRAAEAQSVSAANKSKIQAIRTTHLTDGAFKRWEVFEKVIAGLNGIEVRWDVMQKPDLGQLMFGVDAMLQLRGERFSVEVMSYIAAAVVDDDVAYAPAPLKFCNKLVALLVPKKHAAVSAAVEGGKRPRDSVVSDQLARIREGQLYSREWDRRLLEQTRTIRESGNTRSIR